MRIFQVDAFTAEAFRGNPAGVCLLGEDDAREPGRVAASDTWMQAVAREMNLSETAFIDLSEDPLGLRWFTPEVEVDLCGHATLASAHVLFEEGIAIRAVAFSTRSGILRAESADGAVALDFPALVAQPLADPPASLAEALGVAPLLVASNDSDLVVLLADEDQVRALRPDLGALRRLEWRGVIVTARATMPGVDFISRFFAPRVGIDEDPVTGSSHCALGPFWSARIGRAALVGYQASPRGGIVRVETRGDRVRLLGDAVTVLRGELIAP